MKLHLPTTLLRSLLAAMGAAAFFACSYTLEAATLHPDVSVQTYTNFAQNKGRYATGNTNDLLNYIREQDGGIKITYTGGQESIVLTTPMIDFGSVSHSGTGVAMGYGWMATAAHNNLQTTRNAQFSEYTLPSDHNIQYYGIEYSSKTETVYRHKSSTDFKLIRMSKIVTDVDGTTPYGSENPDGADYDSVADLTGQYLYHAGGGTMYQGHHDGSSSSLASYYLYTTGAVHALSGVQYNAATGDITTLVKWDLSSEGVNINSPLPYNAEAGDSGSGAWAWNEQTQQYEYLSSHHGSGGNVVYGKGNNEWAVETMASYDVTPTLAAEVETIYLNKIDTEGATATADGGANVSGTDYSGAVTDAAGTELARYNGVQTGINLWHNLSGLKDTQTWYTYDNTYLNAREQETTGFDLTYADIFNCSNLVLTTAEGSDTLNIVLNDTVDLGIGYVQFKPGEGQQTADFVVSSEGTEGNLLNSAGFVVEKGASVHLQLTNPADYMREWRKTGEGDLYIEGRDNNDVFLNVGGSGKTYLNRDGGYAAYNVLVNNGATIVIRDTEQIARDLTFGNRGGVLDLNGNSLTWNNDNAADEAGFTIHALDEQAIITNTKADSIKAPVLTWTQTGEHSWLGSFTDTAEGALKFSYQGGEGSRLAMHSIHTDLTHHSRSGIEVLSGTLALEGTLTIHAIGSESGTNTERYANEDDWHYADAKANVMVMGGTFELGSHARLTGDVTVMDGTFIMREGVKHQTEYIEGGYEKENTDNIRDFFGLKGNVDLAYKDSVMMVQFSEGTDSTLVYSGNISGTGALIVDVGVNAKLSGGTLRLEGDNSWHSGTKSVVSGGLYATSDAALGDTSANKWLIEEKGWLASDSFTSAAIIREHIDASSTGVVALTSDIADAIAQDGVHEGLIVGAAEGLEIHYGSADKSLEAIDNKWTLGGGGGTLIVDFLLEDNAATGEKNMLVLGNEYGKGNVHLTNTNNSFSGGLSFAGGVTLTAEAGALGNSSLALSYSNRLVFRDASMLGVFEQNAAGVLLVDSSAAADIDMSTQPGLYLGSQEDYRYTGNITLAEGAAYRFGGSEGVFTVESQLEAGHDVVIDGQTYEGGTYVLTNAQAVNGAVSVIGRDATRTEQTAGSATLGFAADNALANASSFTVKDGGNIDLMGTQQQLNNLTLSEGSTLGDSSGNGETTLHGSATLNGVLNVATIIKTGDGALSLGGTNNATRFEIQGGTATLMSSTATHTNGTLAISNASLELNGQTVNGTVELGDGAALTNMNTIGKLHVVGDSQGSCWNADGSSMNSMVTIGTLTVDAGACFNLTANSATWNTQINTLQGEGDFVLSFNNFSSGGSYIAAFIRGNNASFSGHMSIEADSYGGGVRFGNYNSFGSGVVTFNGTQLYMDTVNSENAAIAATLDVGRKGMYLQTSNVWFTGLSGTGNITGGSANFLGDMSSYSGNIAVAATFGGSSAEGTNYHTVTGNTSSDAIHLFGEGARMGKTGATYKFNYSDDVVLNAVVQLGNVTQAGTGTLVLNQANKTTGVLTINEGGSVELAGGGSWAGSLAGSGTLINSGTGATFSNTASFTGSLSLAEGSSLTFGTNATGSYSLNSGESLGVYAVDGVTAGATLNLGTLTLNGGELSFSAGALVDGEHAALNTNATISAGSTHAGQTITLSDTSTLSTGSYLLASGDWSSLQNTNFTVSGVADYLTGSVSASNSGLLLTVTQVEGVQIWNGTGGQSSWTADTFGTETAGSGNAYFTDTAASKEVSISGAVSAEALVFNAKEDYSLTPEAGATLSASSLALNDSGKVTLGSGVTISGETTLAEGSEVVVKDFNTLGGAVSGHGTVTIDAGAASGNLAGTMSGLDTLNIISGRYNAKGDAVQAENVVVDGGQFYIWSSGTYNYDLTLSGKGWTDNSSDNYADAALRSGGNNVYLTGKISVESDTSVAVTEGNTLWLNGMLEGNGNTVTKTGSKTLWLNTSSSFSADNVSFVVEEGVLCLGGTFNKGLPEGINSIAVQNGATLGFHTKGCEFATELSFEGGSKLDLASGVSSNASDQTYTLTGDVELKSSSSGAQEVLLTAGKNRTLVLDGEVSGDARFAIRGNNPTTTLTLTLNNEHNTFTQGIVVGANRTNAVINLAAAGSAGTGAIELGNATAQLNVAGNTEGYGQMVNTISGEGKLQVTTGNLELTGQNSYSGGTTVGNGASLKLAHASAAGTGSIVLSNAESELVYAGSETAEYGTLANAVSGAGSLKVDSGKVALAADSSVGAATVAQGASLKLSGAAALAVADSVTISNKATPAAAAFSLATAAAVAEEATLENVAMTGSSLTGASEGAQGVVSDAAISINAATFSMADLALVSSDVQLQASELSLSDVVLAGSHISGLSAESTQMNLQQDVTLALSSEAYTLVNGSLYGDAYAGKTVAVYTIDTFSNVSLSGNMLMDISSVAAITSETAGSFSMPDFYAFDFGNRHVDTGLLTLSANVGPGGSVVEGVQAGDSTYLFSAPANGDAVPEPSSAALALLGLTGLAMRRRRK